MPLTYAEQQSQGQSDAEKWEDFVNDPAVAAMFAGGSNTSGAQKSAINRQRAAAAKTRAIQKKRLEFKQETGLRDIEQERESGLEAAINNALQRGIYQSGIRLENEAEVNREADEASSDLQTEIQFALDTLKAQGEAQNAHFDAAAAGLNSGVGMNTGDLWSLMNLSTASPYAQPINTYSPLPSNTQQVGTGNVATTTPGMYNTPVDRRRNSPY